MPGRIHGQSGTPLHNVWVAMRGRCNRSTAFGFKNYGGRGIKVCKSWQNNFVPFRDWALANGWKRGLTIERTDNNKGYSPGNCRIATRADQVRNYRRNLWIEAFGQKKIFVDWAKDYGLTRSTLQTRLRLGWKIEDALLVPAGSKKPSNSIWLEAFGKKRILAEWSRESGIPHYVIRYKMLKKGMSLESILGGKGDW